MSVTWQFSADALSENKCRLLAFNGEDAVLKGYHFDILLMVSDLKADAALEKLADLLKKGNAKLKGIRNKQEEFAWHGMISSASYLFHENNHAVLRLSLRPQAYRLNLSLHSHIFMNMSLPQIINRVLREENLIPDSDFEINLNDKYINRPYTCQYNESTFQFISRHLERMGAYSFIRQTPNGDVLVLADSTYLPEKLPIRDELDWSNKRADEVVFSFIHVKSVTPSKVTLRDYSTEQPGVTKKTSQQSETLYTDSEWNIYASHNIYAEVDSASKNFIIEEANQSAGKLIDHTLRALTAKANQAFGESSISWLQAGYTITINNENYQLISIKHSCNLAGDEIEERIIRRARQAGFIPDIVQGYQNRFYCHQTSLGAYAPEWETPRPNIHGLIHAKVDAAGNGDYAELDQHGRYKVIFFFPEKVIYSDSDAPSDGNRSIPLRMAQNHAGKSSGIHFPLLKDAEVLVAFTDGDPDRPIILSAMPNPDHPSVIADNNQESNIISTPGGNSITMVDTVGKREINMQSPDKKASIRIIEGNPYNIS